MNLPRKASRSPVGGLCVAGRLPFPLRPERLLGTVSAAPGRPAPQCRGVTGELGRAERRAV
jgi:hypothetical protein